MNFPIPCFDLQQQYRQIQPQVERALHEVCEHAAFAGGPFVEEFEQQFADFCQARHAVGVNSGTSALHLALRVLNIGAGDEVLVPANTFIATAWAVSYVNATPVFVDCAPDTWNIDVQAAQQRITPRTKAIIGVHLYGQPCDIDALQQIASDHDLKFVEDCAQAHGALYKDSPVGGFGEMGCFSFYPGKNLGAYGEGGAVTTNNPDYAQRLKSLRNHGSTRRYYHDEIGYNMRMDGFQGAILQVKLAYLHSWNARRQAIARQYQQGITNPKITLQQHPEWAASVYHLFVAATAARDDLMQYLQEHQIRAGLHYPVPCHLQKAYAHLGYREGDCPNAESLARQCVSLPMYAELSDEEAAYVIKVVNAY